MSSHQEAHLSDAAATIDIIYVDAPSRAEPYVDVAAILFEEEETQQE